MTFRQYLKKLNILSYDLSTFFIIKLDILGSSFTWLSENDLEIITCKRSSVGNSMPICKKLFIRDLRSSKVKSKFLIGSLLFIKIKFSNCLD